MPSILARLRTRVVSDSSRQSHQPVLPPPTTPTTTVTTPTPTNDPPIQEESTPVTRKIYPDLDRLPDDLGAGPTTPIRHGLPPPVRRGSSNLHTPATRPPRPPQRPSASSAPSTATGDAESPKASHSSSSSGHTTPSGVGGSGGGFIERLGTWSTFGRRRAPPPSLNEFGGQVSPSPSAWRTRRTNSWRSSRPASKITTSTHSSPHENKENTPRLSSHSLSGRRTPAVAATAASARSNSHRRRQQQQQISTPVARELGFDSPRTLGHPSPEAAAPSLPPPLPPLDHPALHSRARSWIATFPPRARRSAGERNNKDGDKDGGAQGHFTIEKSLRSYRSLPRVQHIFRTRSNNKSVDESNEQGGGDTLAEDTGAGGEAGVPVPTLASWPRTRPINVPVPAQSLHPTHLSPSSSSFSSSSSSSNPLPVSIPVDKVDAHDPIALNLYDPNISLFGNVVPMQQDVPRVRNKKPLRSSLKASARPSPLPIASSSSSNTNKDAAALMPSFSLVAAAATASDTASPHTPVTSPARTENAKVKGKRKAEDVDITPPDSKKATFAVPGVSHVFFLP